MSRYRAPAKNNLFPPYVALLSSWMFDFQSEGAGQGLAIQGVYLAIFMLATAWFFILDGGFRINKNSRESSFFFATAIYLFFSITSALLSKQDIYQIFRISFNIFEYVLVSYCTLRVASTNNLNAFRSIVGWLCLGYAMSSVVIAIAFRGGIDFSTVRYEIQGTSSIAALALANLLPFVKLRRVEVVAALVALLVIFLTVTRTYILVACIQLIVLVVLLRARPKSRSLLLATLAFSILLMLLFAFGNEITERWIDRLFVSKNFDGFDPTLATRASENEFMMNSIIASYWKFFFGSGIAAETSWWIPLEVGGGSNGSIGFGHNQHLSLLFTGGIIGGVPLLIIHFAQWIGAIKCVKLVKQNQPKDPDLIFFAYFSAITITGFLTVNFFSSTFGSRGFTLWYALATGIFLAISRKLKHQGQINS